MNGPNIAPPVGASRQSDLWLELTARRTGPELLIVTSAIEEGTRHELGVTSADHPTPGLRGGEARVHRVVALDVLEYVIDEAAWLEAIVDVLEPGGDLLVRVPAEGSFAWLDPDNLVRYAKDITVRGKQPDELRMKGWHRHYHPDEIEQLLRDAGLIVRDVERSGSPHVEVANFARLMVASIAKGDACQAHRNGGKAGADANLSRLGPFSTKLTVRAIKPG
ncbi:MAG: hypothetical protein H0U31_10505 [Chloroflexia bacterium]|nr:hypothetical protein [Chloroflexia bacterium]